MSPAAIVALTVGGPSWPSVAAQCSDGHPFVEMYRGTAESAAAQAVAKHNAVVHGISRFGTAPTSHDTEVPE